MLIKLKNKKTLILFCCFLGSGNTHVLKAASAALKNGLANGGNQKPQKTVEEQRLERQLRARAEKAYKPNDRLCEILKNRFEKEGYLQKSKLFYMLEQNKTKIGEWLLAQLQEEDRDEEEDDQKMLDDDGKLSSDKARNKNLKDWVEDYITIKRLLEEKFIDEEAATNTKDDFIPDASQPESEAPAKLNADNVKAALKQLGEILTSHQLKSGFEQDDSEDAKVYAQQQKQNRDNDTISNLSNQSSGLAALSAPPAQIDLLNTLLADQDLTNKVLKKVVNEYKWADTAGQRAQKMLDAFRNITQETIDGLNKSPDRPDDNQPKSEAPAKLNADNVKKALDQLKTILESHRWNDAPQPNNALARQLAEQRKKNTDISTIKILSDSSKGLAALSASPTQINLLNTLLADQDLTNKVLKKVVNEYKWADTKDQRAQTMLDAFRNITQETIDGLKNTSSDQQKLPTLNSTESSSKAKPSQEIHNQSSRQLTEEKDNTNSQSSSIKAEPKKAEPKNDDPQKEDPKNDGPKNDGPKNDGPKSESVPISTENEPTKKKKSNIATYFAANKQTSTKLSTETIFTKAIVTEIRDAQAKAQANAQANAQAQTKAPEHGTLYQIAEMIQTAMAQKLNLQNGELAVKTGQRQAFRDAFLANSNLIKTIVESPSNRQSEIANLVDNMWPMVYNNDSNKDKDPKKESAIIKVESKIFPKKETKDTETGKKPNQTEKQNKSQPPSTSQQPVQASSRGAAKPQDPSKTGQAVSSQTQNKSSQSTSPSASAHNQSLETHASKPAQSATPLGQNSSGNAANQTGTSKIDQATPSQKPESKPGNPGIKPAQSQTPLVQDAAQSEDAANQTDTSKIDQATPSQTQTKRSQSTSPSSPQQAQISQQLEIKPEAQLDIHSKSNDQLQTDSKPDDQLDINNESNDQLQTDSKPEAQLDINHESDDQSETDSAIAEEEWQNQQLSSKPDTTPLSSPKNQNRTLALHDVEQDGNDTHMEPIDEHEEDPSNVLPDPSPESIDQEQNQSKTENAVQTPSVAVASAGSVQSSSSSGSSNQRKRKKGGTRWNKNGFKNKSGTKSRKKSGTKGIKKSGTKGIKKSGTKVRKKSK